MATQQLQIDNTNSKVTFLVKKLGFISVNGSLTDLAGNINFDAEDLSHSSFDVSVNVGTISTGNVKRDDHLKNEDFFHIEKYPKIQFRSNSIQSLNNRFKVKGELMILGISKQIEFPFSFKNNTFLGELEINRLDFELGKKMPGFIIGKKISIQIQCSVK